ncbi:PcfJ domain-containing protein [Aquisphaera insulae]|uniref:PcfJ domain-containing protein n=1 Tax=Aquisphaera insulae TaxID=2712864 RepID=UPI0013EAAD39|nr:PcfJ domain-containing protein [Aquisphaera insulae]
MDARPKSNKQKRLELKEKHERRAARQAAERESPRAQALAIAARADGALRGSRLFHRNLPRFLERIEAEATPGTPAAAGVRGIASLYATVNRASPNAYPLAPDRDAFRRLIEVCWERTSLLTGQHAYTFANALMALSAHADAWVRQPGPWVPKTHNADRQFHALLRHLLAKYDVPAFLNSAWTEGLTPAGVIHQRWFIRIAQGRNLRDAEGLPIPLTKKQAHLYLQAPADFDVLRAFRWAQLRELGADERFIRSVAATRVGGSFDHEDFWITVLRWLVDQPMLDHAHHGPIVDYLFDRRFAANVPNPLASQPGQPLLIPAQPNLSMKGRDVDGLLRAVAAWHRRLGGGGHGPNFAWDPVGLPELVHEEGEGKSRKVYRIVQLTNAHALQGEGRVMGHCVASYAQSCRAGRCSIWSLRMIDAEGLETRLVTLEVANASRQVVQARRKLNAMPGPKELNLLHRWTAAGGPSLSKWAVR